MKQTIVALLFLLTGLAGLMAQSPRMLTLEEAVKLGIDNSKQLKQSKNKIDEALARLGQAKDAALPSAKVGFQYLHALMLSRLFELPPLLAKPIKFNFDFPAYLGTLSVTEPIFAGNQLKYARQSADLLVQMSRLDSSKDRVDVTFLVIDAYLNYNKIVQNQQIVAQNMQDVQQKLDEIVKYEGQGLATQNDVLRFQLQKSQMQLTQIELENNRKIAAFDLDIMLGLPDTTDLTLAPVDYRLNEQPVYADLLQRAESGRRELLDLSYEDKVADINIRKIQDQRLPTFAASAGMYYINPTGSVIPTNNNVLVPFTLGVGVSWDIGSLYMTKNKVREATAQKAEVAESREMTEDQIKEDVHAAFLGYLQALDRIKVLDVAVQQAEENERYTEAKYKNNLVNTTDRIDAQTQLYQARVNLELAKSDATIAYYSLLKSTGDIHL